MSEDLVNSIYLGIGSNLGNKRLNIERTKFNLIINNIKILKCSSYYESLSWPNANNPKFIKKKKDKQKKKKNSKRRINHYTDENVF